MNLAMMLDRLQARPASTRLLASGPLRDPLDAALCRPPEPRRARIGGLAIAATRGNDRFSRRAARFSRIGRCAMDEDLPA
jgi:hypothetical protein